MKIHRRICLLLSLVLLLTQLSFFVSAETQPSETGESQQTPTYQGNGQDSSISMGSHSLNGQRPVWGSDKLLETAGAAMLYERSSDTIVYAWNPDLPVYPASLVKIMTCMLALEYSDVSDMVIVTASAVSALPKNTVLNFVVGEEWTMEQMLYCLMVGGYNDAAVVIAEHVAGSQQNFVKMMNEKAREIGCTDTVFTNPTGFHDDKQISTTRDLVKILNAALEVERFTDFFNQTIFRLPANDLHAARYMETTNYMMTFTITQEYYDARVTGGRTGVTEARERCLIVTAESKGLEYIAIVMCAKATMDDEGKIVRFGSYEEVKELLKMGFDKQQVIQVLDDTQILTQYPVAGGENSVTVGPANTFYTVLPSDIISTQLSYEYQQIPSLTAPVKAGEYLTTVQVWYGDVCVAQAPVITKNSSDITTVADQSVYIEKTGDGLKIFLRLLAILAVLAVIVLGGGFLVLMIRRATIRAQHRRRRRNRRRSK